MHCGHLQFQAGSWHNRNYIKRGCIIEGGKYHAEGKRHPLTIPIQRPHIRPIRDVSFSGDAWKKRHLKTLEETYRHAPFFDLYYPDVKHCINWHPHSLARLNIDLTNYMAGWMGIKHGTIVDGERWHFEGDAIDKIIQMCRAVGADRYLSNEGAKDYLHPLEEARLEAAGIWHQWMEWEDPDALGSDMLPDPDGGPLSAIHHLFMLGSWEAKKLIE